MKTYEEWIHQLNELDYQVPPSSVPKAPIERKAYQPETRKPIEVAKPAHQDQDPRKQTEKTPKNTRIALSGVADSLRKRKKSAPIKKGPGAKPPIASQVKNHNPSEKKFKF